MMYITVLLLPHLARAQEAEERTGPSVAATVQYAGSIGWFSGGLSVVNAQRKLEAGLLYGNVPVSKGGPLHTITLKLTYNPFHLSLGPRLELEPLLAGVFFAQHFGDNLSLLWDNRYPRGYYWWTRSLRSHIYMATQASWKLKNTAHLDCISYYFEANTNDLYMYSYFANLHALKPGDIIFLGMGIKLHFK